jgi:hypothetical protein
MVLITILMAINIRGNGIKICSMASALIIILMAISIRGSGSMAGSMARGIIFILLIRASIRAIGRTARNRALGSW